MPTADRVERGMPPEAVGVAVLAVHNLAVHRVLPAPADAALNLATAAGLTSFARHAGCSRADLGIDVQDASSGLRSGLAAAAMAGGVVVLGVALPATRRFFDDRRVGDVGRSEAVYHLAVRIPLATALAEEVLFRGVLLALFRQRRSPAAAVLWTSLLFGTWHVLPTIEHYPGNPASDLAADPSRGRWLAALATTLSTGAAGAVFAWLRLRSGSVLAPVLAHAAVNVSAYLAGRRVTNRRAGAERTTVEARMSPTPTDAEASQHVEARRRGGRCPVAPTSPWAGDDRRASGRAGCSHDGTNQEARECDD